MTSMDAQQRVRRSSVLSAIVRTIEVEIPFYKRNDPHNIALTIPKHIPIPPNSKLCSSEKVEIYKKELDEIDRQRAKEVIANYIQQLQQKKPYSKQEKEQWVARAMKRNTEVLALWERLRPLSGKKSFSWKLIDKYERDSNGNIPYVCTTENREVLSREQLIQLIFQHLHYKQMYKSIKVLEEETGIKYSGFYENSKNSALRTLITIGIKDVNNIYKMPDSSNLKNLDDDVEVQTASIYNHLDLGQNPDDIRKSLWEELSNPNEDNIEYNEKDRSVKAATLNKLVELLTTSEDKFLQSFLLTYRSFTTPEILLHKLIERFQVPDTPIRNVSEQEWKKAKERIILRTGSVLFKWIDNFFHLDWNQNMLRKLTIFMDDFLLKQKQTMKMAQTIHNKVNRELQGKQQLIKFVKTENTDYPIVPRNIFYEDLKLFDIDELEIARQLTLLDQEIYMQIKPVELLNNAFASDKLKHRAPNMIKISTRFNRLSKWISTTILKEESLRGRKNIMIKCIKLAQHLYKLNNFNSLFAISGAFENSAVFRLKHTKEAIPKNLWEEYNQMKSNISSENNCRAYRAHLQKTTPPLVPYLGTFQTDLMFVEDGNKDIIKSKKTGRPLINWYKRRLVADIIEKIQSYQYTPYDIIPVYQIQQVIEKTLNSPDIIVDDKELHALSLKREPRNAKKTDLVE